MLCALTVRKLKPGTFEEFREAFMSLIDPEHPPEGWLRFDMLRNTDDPDEVICFGFFDGTVEELHERSSEMGRNTQQQAIAPFVDAVGADGIFEVVEERVAP
jgi:hypothetical protein